MISKEIARYIMEMRDQRNDGATRKHYRNLLEKIRDEIDKVLKDEE